MDSLEIVTKDYLRARGWIECGRGRPIPGWEFLWRHPIHGEADWQEAERLQIEEDALQFGLFCILLNKYPEQKAAVTSEMLGLTLDALITLFSNKEVLPSLIVAITTTLDDPNFTQVIYPVQDRIKQFFLKTLQEQQK